ncbi:MAG: S9 family peptidase [Prevotella sp.]|nr:S9 family peptidase [Prevotella sp.]
MKRFFNLLAATVMMLVPTFAQKRAFTIADIYRVKNISGVTLSPDGKRLAYTLSQSDLPTTTNKNYVCVMDCLTGRVDTITTDGKSYGPKWDKEGKGLFLTCYASGTSQVCRYDFTAGKCEQITDYEMDVDNAVISPDGRYIAFAVEVYPELGADGKANVAAREKKSNGPLHAHIANELLYRHWTSYADGKYMHIIVYDTEENTYTDVTPGKFHSPVFSPSGPEGFVFSPDSKELCFTSNRTDRQAENTNSDLWVIPVTGGEARCLTADNEAWDGSPQYSPDGNYIAYRFQEVPCYESDRFRLGLINRKTGEKTVLTATFDNWVEDFEWATDSRSIYFLAPESGYVPLYNVDLKKQNIKKVLGGKALSSFQISPKGTIYYTYSTTGKPSALYRCTMKKPQSEQQVTFYNAALEAEVDFRPSEAMWVKGAHGDSVQVFVVKPHGFDPQKKYPLVINVHGGPQMQWMDSYRADWQVYPGAGYVVAYPNPHGSTGRGQKFCRDISGDWGGSPYEDVMAVTDMLEKLPYVDKDRMGAMGWSYGGYFMNWLQGQTKRFKCLASMMGLYDLRSMWGATEELWFPNFDLEGQPWNSELYKKWSPSEYVKNFSTPTLIITGERDYRVSYTQSLQYFSTLQTLGIPSRLIVYDNDGHWPSNLHSMPLYYNAHLEWFHQWLGGDPAPWDSEKMVRNEWPGSPYHQ